MLPLVGDNSYYLELYSRYRRDRNSVPADWCVYFETLDGGEAPSGRPDALAGMLVDAFRRSGHLEADLDPLGFFPRRRLASLARLRESAREQGAADARYDYAGQRLTGGLDALLQALEAAYTGPCTLQAAHIDDEDARDWLFAEYERTMAAPLDAAALERACEAVALVDEFEKFVMTKHPTKKRFGAEGSEGSVVLLRELLRHAAGAGCAEAVMGGMHRGRLATLATVLGKPPATLLAEIAGHDLTDGGPDYTGDVPYHLGHAAELSFDGAVLKVALAPHPSHLGVVAPVAAGLTRARRRDKAAADAVCILLHTDAAFSGQGLIAELMQLSGLDGYGVGGSIHIVVNNQIGFTTMPSEGRTATYCTDIGKMVGAPVLHVNGDDPAALVRAAAVAFAWRQAFGRDVIVDLVCYRRNGHNELDEPRFTQPAMWQRIDIHRPLGAALAESLAAQDEAAARRVGETAASFRHALADAFAGIGNARPNMVNRFQQGWEERVCTGEAGLLAPVRTGVPADRLRALARATTALPADIAPHPKVRQFYEARAEAIDKGEAINFATAEALAFATLLAEGRSVRLSGQDCVRGTFTQRHLRVHDLASERSAMPLAEAASAGARIEAINSPLSEYGVLAFEYGHSLDNPDDLVVWEAQFGDFLNGAQIAVDQFIVSAEAKWQIMSGLVALLPHGLEGQGPDHSSARIERLLQLCANGNIVVANPSTPANYFHLLRRQLHAPWRKPLFVIAPKSLLRARAGVSALADFAGDTHFLPFIADPAAGSGKSRGVILCSGKIYYDLVQARNEEGLAEDVAIHRVEQLYPLDIAAISREISTLQGNGPVVWCQEEPLNQGAWAFVRDALGAAGVPARIGAVGRPATPVPAGGSIDRHTVEQNELVRRALALAMEELAT